MDKENMVCLHTHTAIKKNEIMSLAKNMDEIVNYVKWNKPYSEHYYMFSLCVGLFVFAVLGFELRASGTVPL
jgi:hypothetical protein